MLSVAYEQYSNIFSRHVIKSITYTISSVYQVKEITCKFIYLKSYFVQWYLTDHMWSFTTSYDTMHRTHINLSLISHIASHFPRSAERGKQRQGNRISQAKTLGHRWFIRGEHNQDSLDGKRPFPNILARMLVPWQMGTWSLHMFWILM